MPAAINPVFPVEGVESMDDLMGIAVAMEREAALRYGELALAMDRVSEPELAALFRQLAELERDHEAGLGRWAEREGRGRPVPVRFQWRLPETFEGAAEGAGAHTLTPYAALAQAVANEEEAFAFYSYVAAIAERSDIRERAEALAREELGHVRQLRALRRQAFHAERAAFRALRPPQDARQLALAVHSLETASAAMDEAAARCLAAAGWADGAAELARLAELARARARRHGDAGPGRPSPAADHARRSSLLDAGCLNVTEALRLSLRDAEQVAAVYLATAGETADEAVMVTAQTLAAEAVHRLAAICALMDRQERLPPRGEA